MFATQISFIGIDPTGGQKPMTYAALEEDLRLLALGQGDLNEVLAFVAGQRQAIVAISAPQRLNQGLMEQEQVRASLSPTPRPGRWTQFRIAEYLLRQHRISSPRTPRHEQNCPAWMRVGFSLYRRLEELGYQPHPVESTLQYLEVYPHASFCALLECIPFPKQTLEGRIQRQLVLYEAGLHISDPMTFFEEITRHRLLSGYLPTDTLYKPGELDAMVAAYTAWLAAHHPEQFSLLGDPQEGQIALPVASLKARY